MLSYRHVFHAGNHADVLKHCVLSLIVKALCGKDKPFFYLDTHAGAGSYDLASVAAGKNCEYESGITRLLDQKQSHPLCDAYLSAVLLMNPERQLRFYPGSPRVVRSLLREDDRMVLCERHPRDMDILKNEFAGDGAVRVLGTDGYQALKTLLPPPERRGMVLIDPAYESRDEWQHLLAGIQEAHRRWPTGIIAIWYPVQDRYTADELLRKIKRLGIPKTLMVELSVLQQEEVMRMTGSGMIIINPPWKLESQMGDLLSWLWEMLSVKQQGGYRVSWLVASE